MNMTTNHFSPLKKKILAREAVLGNWSVLASASLAEIGATAGLDFQILDMEHGAFDLGTLENAIRACEVAKGTPLVRVPKLCITAFQAALDFGAHGVIVPQIKSAKDVETAVHFSQYAPKGSRGYNPFIRAANYAAPADNQNGKLHNDFSLVSVILENKEAYEDLANILKVEGLDVIYLGIYDMSVALGCRGNTKAPEVLEFVQKAAQQIIASGKVVGMMVRDEKEMKAALDLGATFLVYSVDAHVFYHAIRQPVEAFRTLKRSE